MNNTHAKPYERVQLFSGGGSRFGYYLGSYAALVAHDLTPDMLLAPAVVVYRLIWLI